MTLSAEETKAVNLLADELETVATWHTGARYDKLVTLSEKVRNLQQVAPQLVAEAEALEAARLEAEALANQEAVPQAQTPPAAPTPIPEKTAEPPKPKP